MASKFNDKEKLITESNKLYKFQIREIDYFFEYAIKYENVKYIYNELSKLG